MADGAALSATRPSDGLADLVPQADPQVADACGGEMPCTPEGSECNTKEEVSMSMYYGVRR